MLTASSETEYRICDCCGKERDCFVKRNFNTEQALCAYCLSVMYCFF